MNSRKVATCLLVLVAAACAVGAIVALQYATTLRDEGVRAVAEVVEVHDTLKGSSSYVVVRFQDREGRAVTAEVYDYLWDPKPVVGDRTELVYDPNDPSGNVVDVRLGPDFFSAWALGIGGIVAAALAWPTWAGKLDWDRLRR